MRSINFFTGAMRASWIKWVRFVEGKQVGSIRLYNDYILTFVVFIERVQHCHQYLLSKGRIGQN